jgi:HK97 family phage major capsid protein
MPEPAAYKSDLTSDQTENVLSIKQIEGTIVTKFNEIKDVVDQSNGELKELGRVHTDTIGKFEELKSEYDVLYDRIQQLEQKGVKLHESANDTSIGQEFIKSEQLKALQDGKYSRARVDYQKTAIVNATGQNQPLVPSERVQGIFTLPNRLLSIRDMIPSTPTSSNLIEYVRENVFTNSAGPQAGGSPLVYENVTKPESGITFTQVTTAVETLAHWIPASRQVIADAPGLQGFIDGRLMYGLKLYEENQLLTGTGSSGQLPGLHTNATAYTVQSPALTNILDIIREMIKQAHVSNYRPDAIVLNPVDWYAIDVMKVGSSDNRYIVGNPREMSTPTLWGLPVVITNAITAGQALLGSFGMGAEIRDREQASVEVSRENSDNFVKNMVTILAEERIALCIYRTEAFIKATIG